MNRHDIEITAARMERAVENGDVDALHKQLNDLKPADQLAVVRELDKINEKKHEKNPDLPSVEFTEAENYKGKIVLKELSIDEPVLDKHGKLIFNPDTNKVSEDRIDNGIFHDHHVFDNKDRVIVWEKEFSGAEFHVRNEYDEATGKLVKETRQTGQKGTDHMIVEANYDAKTGKRQSTDLSFPSGTQMHFDIPPRK